MKISPVYIEHKPLFFLKNTIFNLVLGQIGLYVKIIIKLANIEIRRINMDTKHWDLRKDNTFV
jgi:hypothetical protein